MAGLQRSSTGKLVHETWDADTLNNYGTGEEISGGTAIYNSDGYVTLDNAYLQAISPDDAASDYVIEAEMSYPQVADTRSWSYIYGRYIDNYRFYELMMRRESEISFELKAKRGGSNVYTLGELPFTYNTNAWYKAKFSLNGDKLKGKIWGKSTTEPNTWNIETTDSYLSSGHWRFSTWSDTMNLGEFSIYTSTVIVSTGLPAGYKLRVGTAVATEDGTGTTTVDCSHISFPQSTVEILDNSDTVISTFTAMNDVWGGDVYEYSQPVNIAFGADTLRQVQSGRNILMDSKRQTQRSKSLGADTERGTQRSETLAGDFKRKTLQETLLATDTVRKVRMSVSMTGDTVRQKLAEIVARADSMRRARAEKSIQADSIRRTQRNESLGSDSHRSLQITSKLVMDTVRRTRKIIDVLADTFRSTVATYFINVNGDTKRKVVKGVGLSLDTRKSIIVTASVRGDSLRKITVRTAVPLKVDTVRKISRNVNMLGDTKRAVYTITQTLFGADTERKVQRTSQIGIDSLRQSVILLAIRADTERRLITRVQVINDLFRKTQVRVGNIYDTPRDVLTKLVAKAPDYVVNELANKYSLFEVPATYEAGELNEQYAWKEDNIDMRNFKLGESKEVGIELVANDGNEFTITKASYKYEDVAGNVLESGEATIDDHKVFILLTPKETGFSQNVTFTITATPAEVIKNEETIMVTVIVNVME
ncbi:MAG: hypothetical protein FH756_15835 [Firmicutes bacterium]|nr:hypothetical protein [Bacillota bacterium]